MAFQAFFEFTEPGLEIFKQVFTGQLDEHSIDMGSSLLISPIEESIGFSPKEFRSAKDMASSILAGIGTVELYELLPRTGLWAWLTFVLRDQLFKRDRDGKLKVGELHRWYPSNPNDWQKGQRHLVRMPVLLVASLGDDVDHLLCSPPSVLPDIREQLTSQQDMFNPVFQKVARALYFDDATGALKRGAGGKGRGSPRRLAKVRQQFDVTWSIEDLDPDLILAMLPQEFGRFKPNSMSAQD